MLIAYQSLNANVAKKHDLGSLSNQYHTRMAVDFVVGRGDEALVLPINPKNPMVPVAGPAHKVKITEVSKSAIASGDAVPVPPAGSNNPAAGTAQPGNKKRKLDDSSTSPPNKKRRGADKTVWPNQVFGDHITSLYQNFYRAFGRMPDLLVCGELDANNDDFKDMIGSRDANGALNMYIEASPQDKACQSFTAFSTRKIGERLAFGEGYVVYSLYSMTVVFVHVPNAIATKRDKVINFYHKIAQQSKQAGRTIHLVIGDTNQSSSDFTAEALNSAFNTKAYKNALEAASVSPIDNHEVTRSGTNSNATKFFDVAVYRSDVVSMTKKVCYISQSAAGNTVTDHYGLAVMVAPNYLNEIPRQATQVAIRQHPGVQGLNTSRPMSI